MLKLSKPFKVIYTTKYWDKSIDTWNPLYDDIRICFSSDSKDIPIPKGKWVLMERKVKFNWKLF